MIAEPDKAAILKCARKYNVSAIYLFGSATEPNVEARDIDLGVTGLEPERFFKFYGELIKHLSKPVDLVDLSEESMFTKLVEETGIRIYG